MTKQVKTRKKIIFTITAVVLGGLIAFVVGELLIRVGGKAVLKESVNIESKNNPVTKPHPQLGHVLTKNKPEYGHDARGFKNTEAIEKADIVALGDSHTNGKFVKGEYISWPNYLNKKLEGKSVYNMGVHGYGLAQYKALMDDAFKLAPDTIVIAPYLGNDVFDTYDIVYHREGWEKYKSDDFNDTQKKIADERDEIDRPLQGVRKFVRKHSKLYKFIGNRTRLWRERVGLASPKNVGVSDWSADNPNASLRYEKGDITTLFWAGNRLKGVNLERKNVKEGLRLAKLLMKDIAQQAKKEQVRVVVAMIPSKLRVYEKEVKERVEKNRYYSDVITNEKKIEDALLSACEQVMLKCFSVLPYLQEKLSKGVKLYPESWNGHPNKRGYKAYAEAIKAGLVSVINNKQHD